LPAGVRIGECHEGVLLYALCGVLRTQDEDFHFKILKSMQNIELQNFGLLELDRSEALAVNGGQWYGLLKGITVLGVANAIIENWDDIKKGFNNGWNLK
jgi:hypothetical protein